MSNTEWIEDIDVIIRSNIVAISKIFEEMKSKVSDTPFNSESMLEQLNASERLIKEVCIGFITQMLKWIRQEFNISHHEDSTTKAAQLNALEESLNLD